MNLNIVSLLARFHGMNISHISEQDMYTTLSSFGYDLDSNYQINDKELDLAEFSFHTSFCEGSDTKHSHDYAELIYFIDDTNLVYQIGTQEYKVSQGDLLIIMPKMTHHIITPIENEQNIRRISLCIDFVSFSMLGLLANEKFAPIYHSAFVINIHHPEYEYINRMFKKGITEDYNHDSFWKINQVGTVVSIVGSLLRIINDKQNQLFNKRETELIELLVSYINDNYSSKITLDDTADHFFVSKSTITHLFREKLNTSFYRYLTEKRLTAAKAYIMNNSPLDDIYHQIGFTNYQTFFRAFKQEFGMSPSEYRNMYLNSLSQKND